MRAQSWLLAVLVVAGLAVWIGSGYMARGDNRDPKAAQASAPAPQAPKMTVQVREQRAEAVTRRLELQGQAMPDRRVTVRAQTGGRVQAVSVNKGARIEGGATIAKLDMADRGARLQEARALVKQRDVEAKASHKLSTSGYQSSTKVQAAEAALEAAKARLAGIREEVADTKITAPFAGVLDTRTIEEGDYLSPGDAVATVVDLDPLRVVGHVSQQDIERVSEGKRARVQFATGEERDASVSYIAAEAEPETRTFRVELTVANAKASVPAGVSATVYIPIETVQAQFLSPALLSLNDDGVLGAKTVAGGDRVAFHPVEVLRAERDGVWVTGLPATARVITIGQGFVRAGETVKAVPAADSELDLERPDGPAPAITGRG